MRADASLAIFLLSRHLSDIDCRYYTRELVTAFQHRPSIYVCVDDGHFYLKILVLAGNSWFTRTSPTQ